MYKEIRLIKIYRKKNNEKKLDDTFIHNGPTSDIGNVVSKLGWKETRRGSFRWSRRSSNGTTYYIELHILHDLTSRQRELERIKDLSGYLGCIPS